MGEENGADPSPPFFGSADSTGDKVVCFHVVLEVLILQGLEARLCEEKAKIKVVAAGVRKMGRRGSAKEEVLGTIFSRKECSA
jgi:hypothetical protein